MGPSCASPGKDSGALGLGAGAAEQQNTFGGCDSVNVGFLCQLHGGPKGHQGTGTKCPQGEPPAHIPTIWEGRREAILGVLWACFPLLSHQVRRASRGPLRGLCTQPWEFLRISAQISARPKPRNDSWSETGVRRTP